MPRKNKILMKSLHQRDYCNDYWFDLSYEKPKCYICDALLCSKHANGKLSLLRLASELELNDHRYLLHPHP